MDPEDESKLRRKVCQQVRECHDSPINLSTRESIDPVSNAVEELSGVDEVLLKNARNEEKEASGWLIVNGVVGDLTVLGNALTAAESSLDTVVIPLRLQVKIDSQLNCQDPINHEGCPEQLVL